MRTLNFRLVPSAPAPGRVSYFRLKVILALVATLAPLACRENAKTAIPRLTKELSSSDTHTRSKAALALASYGSAAQPAVPTLVQLLHDPNNGVKSSAAFALREIGGEKAESALAKATASAQ